MHLVSGTQGKLPGWIRLPKSAALPFGSFEAALDASPDGDAARRKIVAADADPSAANLAAVRCVSRSLAHSERAAGIVCASCDLVATCHPMGLTSSSTQVKLLCGQPPCSVMGCLARQHFWLACREAVLDLEPPPQLTEALEGVLAQQGLTLGEINAGSPCPEQATVGLITRLARLSWQSVLQKTLRVWARWTFL